MSSLVMLFGFVVWAYNRALGRVQTSRGAAVFSLAIAGVTALTGGFFEAAREDARARYGVVTTGAIIEKLSSMGEEATRTFGPGVSKTVRTIEGYALQEMIARWLVTGSSSAWVVDYRFPCERPTPCQGREFVAHDRWALARRGDRVDIRWVPNGFGGARFAERSRWAQALIEMSVGGVLLFAAWGTSALSPLTARVDPDNV